MRFPFIGILVLLATPQLVLAQRENPNRADWGPWARAFSDYAAHPSATNAGAVEAAFFPPTGRVEGATPPPFDSVESWLAVLERQVIARDPSAVRLAFMIEPSMGSGDYSEALDIMLGKLIRLAPRLFLSELSQQARRQENVSVPGANLGPEFVDRFQAQCRELRLRVRALQSVSDSSLATVRRRVVSMLDAQAKEVCST